MRRKTIPAFPEDYKYFFYVALFKSHIDNWDPIE